MKLSASEVATTFTLAYFLASLMVFLDHSPVLTMSMLVLPRSRFIGTMAFSPMAPPCMNSTL